MPKPDYYTIESLEGSYRCWLNPMPTEDGVLSCIHWSVNSSGGGYLELRDCSRSVSFTFSNDLWNSDNPTITDVKRAHAKVIAKVDRIITTLTAFKTALLNVTYIPKFNKKKD